MSDTKRNEYTERIYRLFPRAKHIIAKSTRRRLRAWIKRNTICDDCDMYLPNERALRGIVRRDVI